MPELRTRRQQPNPVTPQVPIPGEFPSIPDEVLERFPSAKDWERRLNDFWGRTSQALQEAQRQTAAQVNSTVIWTVDRFLIYTNEGQSVPMFALDDTGIRLGNVLVINTPGRKVYIGAGNLANDDTPFYIDTLGNFSLGASLVWDPDTDTLTITGIINATSGTIGGFEIGADYIRDSVNSFGLASTITGGDDVRFWAGATFANRATAPLRITEAGAIVATSGTVGGFTITSSKLEGASGSTVFGMTVAVGGGVPIFYAGGSTPSNGTFRVDSAGAVISSGFTGPIGATTPGTGAFTTLGASGADNAFIFRVAGSTAKLRVGGYIDSTYGSSIGAVNAAESAYTVLSLLGSEVKLSSSGTIIATVSSTGLAVTGRTLVNSSDSAGQLDVNFNGGSFNGISLKETAGQSGAAFAAFRKSDGTGIGSITRVGTTDAVAYNTSSDCRLKTNIRDLPNSGAILDALQPRLFDWKSGDKDTYGFVAQEVYAIFPQAVSSGDNDPETITKQWQMDASKLVPVLTAEIKSLRGRYVIQDIEISSLRARVAQLEATHPET